MYHCNARLKNVCFRVHFKCENIEATRARVKPKFSVLDLVICATTSEILLISNVEYGYTFIHSSLIRNSYPYAHANIHTNSNTHTHTQTRLNINIVNSSGIVLAPVAKSTIFGSNSTMHSVL